jgi:hypothetical protein
MKTASLQVLGCEYWGTEVVLCPVHAISTKLATTGGAGEDAKLIRHHINGFHLSNITATFLSPWNMF